MRRSNQQNGASIREFQERGERRDSTHWWQRGRHFRHGRSTQVPSPASGSHPRR